MESSLTIGWCLSMCLFLPPHFFFAIHSSFLSSIDLSGKDNRPIDLQAQQLACFTYQFRPQSSVKERIALSDDWLLVFWNCRFKRCSVKILSFLWLIRILRHSWKGNLQEKKKSQKGGTTVLFLKYTVKDEYKRSTMICKWLKSFVWYKNS